MPVFILSERTDINITQNAEKRINTERQDFDMKYMNNHFGQSRIFGKARFMAEPAGDIGGDDPGSSGGGSGNGGFAGAHQSRGSLPKEKMRKDTK